MLINGRDIGEFGARQHKATFGYPERDVSHEWPTGGANPTFHRNAPVTETLTLEIIVTGEGTAEIRGRVRQVLGLFDAPSVLIYLTGGGWFLGTLQGAAATEPAKRKWHKLTLTVRGIAYREIVGVGMMKRLPASVEVDAFPVGGCEGILTVRSDTYTDATITVTGIARDRRGADAPISFRLRGIGEEGVTVYIGELPMGIPYFAARENPTMLSLEDGTPLAGNVGAAPRLGNGRNTVTVTATDLYYEDGPDIIDTGGAVLKCDLTIYYLSVTDHEP